MRAREEGVKVKPSWPNVRSHTHTTPFRLGLRWGRGRMEGDGRGGKEQRNERELTVEGGLWVGNRPKSASNSLIELRSKGVSLPLHL